MRRRRPSRQGGGEFFRCAQWTRRLRSEGQILREAESLFSVIGAGAAISRRRARSTVAPESRLCEAFRRWLHGAVCRAICQIPDMDAHQGALALKFLVRLGDSVASDSS